MSEPEVGRPTISEQERDAIAAWTAEVARDRQAAADAKTAAAARRRRNTLLGAGLTGVLVLGGVGFGISQAAGPDTASPNTQPSLASPVQTTATPSSAPTPSPVALTPVQQAEAAAERAYREYVRVDNAIANAGYQDFTAYENVAVSPERLYLQEQALISQNTGQRRVGEITVKESSVLKSDLEPGPGNYPYVVLRVCHDVSGTNVVDRAGKSVVSAGRPDFVLATATVNHYKPGTDGVPDGGWRVYEVDAPGDGC